MDFSFGAARALYKKNLHPRVLIGPGDVAVLRRMTRAGDGAKIFRAMRQKTAPLVERVLAASDLPRMLADWNARWDMPGTTVVWGLHDTAMVGLLGRDADAIEAVKRVLAAFPDADRLVERKGNRFGYGLESNTFLAYDLLHGELSPAERGAFTAWAADFFGKHSLEHVGHAFFRGAGANIGMGVVLTALSTLLAIGGDPGVPDLGDAKQRLVKMLEAALFSALGPAGYPSEDAGYGTGMAGWLAYLVEATRRAGLYDAYDPETGCPHFTRFGRAALHFVQPWGDVLSNTGDHGDDFGERNFVLARLAAETRDPALNWLLGTLYYPSALSGPRPMPSDFHIEVKLTKDFRTPANSFSLMTLPPLKKRVHPKRAGVPTQFMDRGRGIVSFRSSWEEDAAFVVFDGAHRSPAAMGHSHDSGGHFSLSALGEYFAIDTGRYSIDQDQHNVVLVDGKSGQTTGGEWRGSYYQANLTAYEPGDFVDSASVDTSLMSNCLWARRTVGLVKGVAPYLWTVEDVNFDNCVNGPREFWWQLQTHPDNRIALHGDRATITGAKRGHLLDVHFALPAPTSYPTPHSVEVMQNLQRCGSEKYVTDPAVQAKDYRRLVGDLVHGPVFMRPRLVGKVTGYCGRFMSLMIPRKKGERPAKVERLASVENSLAVRITFRGIEDTLIWAYEHHLLEAGEVKARGNWCVVRRDGKTGRLIDSAINEGGGLRVAGKKSLEAHRTLKHLGEKAAAYDRGRASFANRKPVR